MLAPEIETLAWAEQIALDDAMYRSQLAYLLERSVFYQKKLKGFPPGGLADISALPFTEKSEIRVSCTADSPIGAHLCVERPDIVRIYSTSGAPNWPAAIKNCWARSKS